MQATDAPFILSRRDKILAVVIGAVFGFIVGLTSVGSGTFFGLIMVLVYPLTMSKIVGTDIFHAAALLWVAGIGHIVGGNVDFHATLWLLTGSIPGVLISSRFTVRRAGVPLSLTAKEFAILEYFMLHVDELVTRSMLLEHCWDESYEGLSNLVDVHVSRVRRKVDVPGRTPLFQTIRGAGFILSEQPR